MNGKTVNLQIPVSKELKIAAQQSAMEMGFSSLQEILRIFIHDLAQKTVDVVFTPKESILSEKAEKRYLKMIKNIKKSKEWYKAENVDEFVRQLNS